MAKPPIVRVLAFDPGTVEMGWAVIDHDPATGTNTVVKFGTLKGHHLIKDRKGLFPLFTKNFIVLDVYEEVVLQMIQEYCPHYVAVEDAFAHKFVDAFAKLVLVIHTIRRCCKEALGRDLHLISPMQTKKVIAKNSMAKKDEIRAAVLSHPQIVIRSTKQNPIEQATEHVFDAIGHGCTFVILRLPTLLAELALLGLPLPQPVTPAVVVEATGLLLPALAEE